MNRWSFARSPSGATSWSRSPLLTQLHTLWYLLQLPIPKRMWVCFLSAHGTAEFASATLISWSTLSSRMPTGLFVFTLSRPTNRTAITLSLNVTMLRITRPTSHCKVFAFLTGHHLLTLIHSLGCFPFVVCSLSHTDWVRKFVHHIHSLQQFSKGFPPLSFTVLYHVCTFFISPHA